MTDDAAERYIAEQRQLLQVKLREAAVALHAALRVVSDLQCDAHWAEGPGVSGRRLLVTALDSTLGAQAIASQIDNHT